MRDEPRFAERCAEVIDESKRLQPQTPDVQVVPAAQTTPHAPQFISSVAVFTQTPEQLVLEHVHTPELQTKPVPHTRPHVPQLRSSVLVFVQSVPQRVRAQLQVPSSQVQEPVPHDRPQLPQFATSI
jgi:hypothetical protein